MQYITTYFVLQLNICSLVFTIYAVHSSRLDELEQKNDREQRNKKSRCTK